MVSREDVDKACRAARRKAKVVPFPAARKSEEPRPTWIQIQVGFDDGDVVTRREEDPTGAKNLNVSIQEVNHGGTCAEVVVFTTRQKAKARKR